VGPESASLEASLDLKREDLRLLEAIHRGDPSESVSDPRRFVERVAREARVVGVPGSAFYRPGHGGNYVRFAFCKRDEVLREAVLRLGALASR